MYSNQNKAKKVDNWLLGFAIFAALLAVLTFAEIMLLILDVHWRW